MTRRLKTVEYAFETEISNGIATASAIGSSATHTFVNQDGTDLTVYIPETNGRQFHSVCVEICWRNAGSNSLETYKIGIKLGAVAVNEIFYYQDTVESTGNHETTTIFRDVTEYFNTNFGTTGSNTCQVTFAAGGVVSVIQNLVCKLIITYSYDDSYAPTLLKTVRIPVQSFFEARKDSSFGEIGADDSSPSSPNSCAIQYPALDTFLPESDKVYRQVFIEILGNENLNQSVTTDFSSSLAIRDSGNTTTVTGSQRCLLDQQYSTYNCFFKDIWQINTGTVPTNVGYRLMFAAGLLQRFLVGAIINVTYEYTGSSQTVMNSVMLAPESIPCFVPYQDTPGVISFSFYVSEPNSSTSGRNALVFDVYANDHPASGSLVVENDSFEEGNQRVLIISGNAQYGAVTNIMRFDNRNSTFDNTFAWPISQGWNYFHVTMSQMGRSQEAYSLGKTYAIINYTSSVAQTGPDSHNHSVNFSIIDQQGRGNSTTNALRETNRFIFQSASLPCTGNLDNNWFINSIWFETYNRSKNLNKANKVSSFLLQKTNFLQFSQTVNKEGEGWVSLPGQLLASSYTSQLTFQAIHNATQYFNRHAAKSGGLDPNISRNYHLKHSIESFSMARKWVTFHSNYEILSGTITGYLNAQNIPVEIWNADTDEREALVYTNAQGTFTAPVFFSGSEYYATALETGSYRGRSNNSRP